jgi:hypothetical protein
MCCVLRPWRRWSFGMRLAWRRWSFGLAWWALIRRNNYIFARLKSGARIGLHDLVQVILDIFLAQLIW